MIQLSGAEKLSRSISGSAASSFHLAIIIVPFIYSTKSFDPETMPRSPSPTARYEEKRGESSRGYEGDVEKDKDRERRKRDRHGDRERERSGDEYDRERRERRREKEKDRAKDRDGSRERRKEKKRRDRDAG